MVFGVLGVLELNRECRMGVLHRGWLVTNGNGNGLCTRATTDRHGSGTAITTHPSPTPVPVYSTSSFPPHQTFSQSRHMPVGSGSSSGLAPFPPPHRACLLPRLWPCACSPSGRPAHKQTSRWSCCLYTTTQHGTVMPMPMPIPLPMPMLIPIRYRCRCRCRYRSSLPSSACLDGGGAEVPGEGEWQCRAPS